MERRSMVMIEAEHPDAGTLAVLLQNAETCRLVRPGGAHVSVAELAAGDDVLVVCDRVARHTGVAVEEDAWLER
jgi:3-dehydroquinate synthase II